VTLLRIQSSRSLQTGILHVLTKCGWSPFKSHFYNVTLNSPVLYCRYAPQAPAEEAHVSVHPSGSREIRLFLDRSALESMSCSTWLFFMQCGDPGVRAGVGAMGKLMITTDRLKLSVLLGMKRNNAGLSACNVATYLKILTKLNSVAWVSERTIPTERPPLVSEVSTNFCG
jgi:hypothetical protein